MSQVQNISTLPEEQQVTPSRSSLRRLLFCLLIGIGATLVLTILEVAVFWAVNPSHALSQLSPAAFALPVSELIICSLAVFTLARPVALMSYLRAVHQIQEEYHRLYTPLTAVANIRKAVEEEYQDYDSAPTLYAQDEQVSILDLVQQEDAHQMILGVPGAGKTMALRVFQYMASQAPLSLAFSHGRLPIYIPMKNYSLFLKRSLPAPEEYVDEDQPRVTIFDYLQASDLPGMRSLNPHLETLAEQGRLLLLCDGLNEIDSNYLSLVSTELVDLMRHTRNRVVMTCREVDYREQADFVQLVEEGHVARAVIYPLRPEQVYDFVELYVEKQDKSWKHTAGQIMQVIDRSRLRYHCTNPMMLFTLMGIIDKIGMERGKQIDTRGRLLREYVRHLLDYERHQPRWMRGTPAPSEQDVVHFLSEVACAARWANDRNAIQLRISSPVSTSTTDQSAPGKFNFDELGDELRYWLDEHPAQGPFASEDGEDLEDAFPYDDRPLLLQFALTAGLIDISPGGVLSFRHELIAEYFVAEYFFAFSNRKAAATLAIREELLENVGRWSEPVAIWAGLLDKPLDLAERFGALGLDNGAYILQALALGLVCVGVLWTPPQAEIQRTVILPPSMEEALSIAVRNRAAREELARIFTRCAEEGGQEVYRSLLPLIMVEGVDDLLTLLDKTIVPELLFTHLQDAVDNVAYETQVKRLTRVLGRFGAVVVERSAQLSLPMPERSVRLRAAAVNVLGGTSDLRAVAPLVARLRDTEPFIVERATNALIRLGPTLTLTRILQELENRTPDPFTMRVHRAALLILGRFLEERTATRQVSLMQYQHILERIVPVLTSNYQKEPDVQAQAREILVSQAQNVTTDAVSDQRWEKVILALIAYLPTQNDVAARNVVQALQEIGTPATPRLLDLLNHTSEVVRVRVVVIFQATRDLQALPGLLRLLHDPSHVVQQQVSTALHDYAPESVPGLVALIVKDGSDSVAENAALILTRIGAAVVEPANEALFLAAPTRARLLVQVLETIHDPRAIPHLIRLLEKPQLDPVLAVALIRALGQFKDAQVVPSLLDVLLVSSPLLYEEAITALSQLGEIAFPGLVAALDVEQESLATPRVRRAILGIAPFPGDQLIHLLEKSSDAQAKQIMQVFANQGPEGAQVLVKNILHSDIRVRECIHQTLDKMAGGMVVPALLEVLSQQALRKIVNTFLLKYPSAAIPPLVDLLGEPERGGFAAAILPQFGTSILRPLITGLDDQRSQAREFSHRIVVSLVRQNEDPQIVLHEIIGLFNPPPPVRAREELVALLSHELADISLPGLLDGLEDAHLIDDVAETFVRLSRRSDRLDELLTSLIESLAMDERRRGAEVALTRIGGPAVLRVGELIIDANQYLARSAKQILRDIGVPALPFIWSTQSDRSHPTRRAAASEIFRSMPSDVIKDELVSLLISQRRDDVAMAVTLLLERVHDEQRLPYPNRVMVPELVKYIETHTVENVNLRIIALLLLLGEQTIVDHLIQALGDYAEPHKQLVHLFLLLGAETQQLLREVFNDSETKAPVRAELATVLGMRLVPEEIATYAQNLSKYGLANNRTTLLHPDQLSVALRSVGALLASGRWDSRKLLEMRDSAKGNEPARELYSVLLGWRYEPQIELLKKELEELRVTYKKEILDLGTRIITEQKRAQGLDAELEKLRSEHGFRGDELQQIKVERDSLKARVEQLTREKAGMQASADLANKEKGVLSTQLDRTKKDLQDLQARQRLQGQTTTMTSGPQTNVK
jgi:HEAT repeat protein